MTLDHYELEVDDKFLTYEFVSKGPKGEIPKLIQFTFISQEGVYNLALGDLETESGEINDHVVTNNRDTEKILATVAVAVYRFCNQFSGVWVYARGNTDSRTRLYRMGLNKYLDIIREDFMVYGRLNGNWEIYEKGANYQAFAVQKNFKFEI